jgi:hypothetical protein
MTSYQRFEFRTHRTDSSGFLIIELVSGAAWCILCQFLLHSACSKTIQAMSHRTFTCLYTSHVSKKRKRWIDGLITVNDSSFTLSNTDGTYITKGTGQLTEDMTLNGYVRVAHVCGMESCVVRASFMFSAPYLKPEYVCSSVESLKSVLPVLT